jgi:cytochrome c553
MRNAILAAVGLMAALCVLCGCLLATVVAVDFWRYGVPAMEARREAQRQASGNSFQEAGAPTPSSNAPAGSSRAGSDALVRKHNCQACHGQDLRGQQLGALHAPDLTSSGVAGTWSEAEFIAAMRTGQRPDGSQMSDAMPWRAIGKASDEELQQLWAYLKSLP